MNEKMITHIDRVEVMRFLQRKKDRQTLSAQDAEELAKITELVDTYYNANIPHAKAQ